MSSERIFSTPTSDEKTIERAMRPLTLKEYIGQSLVCEQMALFIAAAKTRGEALDHVLIAGPPGLGKTTLAHIIAREMGAQIKSTSGPVLEKAGDLAALLTNLDAKDILFIDEIHRLNPAIEEILYPALEDYQLDILIGEGPSARSIKLDLPPFTLVGATTRTGLLTSPLRDRFGITQHLSFYTVDQLAQIIMRSAQILNAPIQPQAAKIIAARSRGTPRIANRWLRRVRDVATIKAVSIIESSLAEYALDLLAVDEYGLDNQDRRLLLALLEKFEGGPVGIDSLAAAIAEEPNTIEEVIEPFLIQQGFITRTPRGRVALPLAYQHFKLHLPKEKTTSN